MIEREIQTAKENIEALKIFKDELIKALEIQAKLNKQIMTRLKNLEKR